MADNQDTMTGARYVPAPARPREAAADRRLNAALQDLEAERSERRLKTERLRKLRVAAAQRAGRAGAKRP